MRILAIMITMIYMNLGLAFAATVNLNDGRVVQGDILKQDDKSVQISVDGVTMTYYADEIKDIDGKSFAESQAASVPQAELKAALPVAQPQAASETPAQPVIAPPDTTASSDGVDPDKRALILKFIEVFGTRQALINNFQMMIKQIEKEKPDEAQKIRDRVKVDEIIERLIPIYDRNFSSDDLNAFIRFYTSPEGRKLITTIPELMKESVQESVKYMKEKFPEVDGG